MKSFIASCWPAVWSVFYTLYNIIKHVYILNSTSEIDFKFGLNVFHEKRIDSHHFGLITWLMYVLQTRILVIYRLVCKQRTRLLVHLKFANIHFIYRCSSGENIKSIAHVNLEIWVYGTIYRPALKIPVEQLAIVTLHKE